MLSDYVTRSRVTFAVVVDVDTTGIERDHVAHFVDDDLEGVFDVERSSKRARDLVERVNLSMCLFDLIVGNERTALARLRQVNCAQLYRRLGRVVRRLMLKSESCDLFVKTWQVRSEEHTSELPSRFGISYA